VTEPSTRRIFVGDGLDKQKVERLMTAAGTPPPALAVVAFWRAAGEERWFKKDEAFDRTFREQFAALHEAAAAGQLNHWLDTAEGALALVLLLDQYPRNSFRGSARMFATDSAARDAAQAAIAKGFDRAVPEDLQNFFYLPFEHSEDLADQDRCIELTARLGPDLLKWAELHRDIIRRFGRFPHRNAVLGRTTTADEKRFLDEGGFGG
jgi:uncharacterized protein (DUF924 family)